jgi:cellulose synthase/poly-beta-1,6-N-acetylglucosamine synthase-like glycosyltransferase
VEFVIQIVLWLSLGLLFYTYAGYPLLLWLLSKAVGLLKTSSAQPDLWPTVSIVISAYNEEAVILRRIQNLLEQDYPHNRMEILIGSDGSTDSTCELVARSGFSRTQIFGFSARRGKASVLNDLVARATGEYVIFTDAATVFFPDAIKHLISGFWRYPTAAVIGGMLELRPEDTSRNTDGLYWRYEMFLQHAESLIGAGLGASGAIYTVRRRHYCPLPPDTMADDLLEPMLVRLRMKGDVVLHSPARAWQATPKHVADEFRRRIRTGAGISHVVLTTRHLLRPQWGLVALAFWSHKMLRLLGPWFLLTALAANIWLFDQWIYRLLLTGQAAGYGLALSAGRLRVVPVIGRAAVAARYFLVLNSALAIGCLKFLFGMSSPTWSRTVRHTVETSSPVWSEFNQEKDVRENRPAA